MARTEFNRSGGVTAASRRASQKAGHTMKGGSFPINNAADLARAKHDVGRAKDPAAARAWIDKRAKELGKPKIGEAHKEPPADKRHSEVKTDRGHFAFKHNRSHTRPE
jgi:hypothetical protein